MAELHPKTLGFQPAMRSQLLLNEPLHEPAVDACDQEDVQVPMAQAVLDQMYSTHRARMLLTGKAMSRTSSHCRKGSKSTPRRRLSEIQRNRSS